MRSAIFCLAFSVQINAAGIIIENASRQLLPQVTRLTSVEAFWYILYKLMPELKTPMNATPLGEPKFLKTPPKNARVVNPVYPSDVTTVQTAGSVFLVLLEGNGVDWSQFAAAVMKMLGPRMRDGLDPFRDGAVLGFIRTSDLYGLTRFLKKHHSTKLPKNALSEALWYARSKKTDMVQYLRSLGLPEPMYFLAVDGVTPEKQFSGSYPHLSFPTQNVGALEWGPSSKTELDFFGAKEYCASQQGSDWRLPTVWELCVLYQIAPKGSHSLWSSNWNGVDSALAMNCAWGFFVYNLMISCNRVRCVRSL